eukprot:gnl/MRDRNA2_/MRDRNA2_82033_c0_seq3.p1 gnl/MRDRNA2_/MRDRNA2_82033_c0~~gnl/MRDRNA2_/MRDRNA2_82033_c0_seq3.p1  ORF type:complete len:369 (+),score=74.86 gnl/MRDRNA2_/MRDRNA2_82033_c0_seq3:518-1624(+)
MPLRHHHHHHHHKWGAPRVATAATAGLLGAAVGGAVVATAATAAVVASRPAPPRPKPRPVEIVVVESQAAAPSVVVRARPQPWAKGKGKGRLVNSTIMHAPPPPQLKVSSIQIPAHAIEMRGGITFFAVDVYPEDGGNSWRVMRRYNDFHNLRNILGPEGNSFPGACFPRKHLTGCTGAKLETRRADLELWLLRALQHPLSRNAWVKKLIDFLEAGRAAISPSSAPATVASSGPLSVAQPLQAAEASAAQLIQIQVPSGCVPGQHLGVTVPDGRQLTVVMPEAVKAGDVLDLEFNPATGVLTYMQEVAETSNGVVLEVQVPPGVTSGQLMSVPCPNGQNVTVAVPENATSGSVIQLSFDQVKGTLTHI